MFNWEFSIYGVFMIVFLSIISLAATIIGLWYVSEKKKVGFIWYTVSLLCQLYIFTVQTNWFLVVQMIVLIASNILVYVKWRKGDLNE